MKVALLITCNSRKETSPMRCLPPLQVGGEERTRCPYSPGDGGSWFLLGWWCQWRRWKSSSTSSTWSPKNRIPHHHVLRRPSPLLPGPHRSYCHPALMPALLPPFPRNTEAPSLHPEPSGQPLNGSLAQRGAFLWLPDEALPAHKHNRNCSKGHWDAKGCWS